jgi:putative selenium metabolism protein SsnA
LKEKKMLITNANLITWEAENRILEDHALFIQDGKIVEIGPTHELESRYEQSEKVDAYRQYVMPGNICAHTHFYGAYSRGLAIPGPAPKDFPEILQKLWWPLDLALDAEAIRYSALVSLVDAIKHGTTTLIDHHASPNAIDGSLDIIADAVQHSGLRAVLCYEVTDRNGKEGAGAGIYENVRFLDKLQNGRAYEGRVAAIFGLHASLTISQETLEACREAAPAGIGFHIHVAEHEVDEYDSLAKSGLRVVDRLYQHGILGETSIAAHAVHVDAREVALLAETGTWVTHQPRSNMNNGVGVGNMESLMRAGVRVALGNDGFSNAMWEEWKTAYLVHKVWNRDPRRMSGYDILKIGVYNNAGLANICFPDINLGVIHQGAAADLIFVDYHPFTPISAENLPWHILFGFRDSMVTTTIVQGKLLMSNGKLTTLDEEGIYNKALELAPEVWERYRQNVP